MEAHVDPAWVAFHAAAGADPLAARGAVLGRLVEVAPDTHAWRAE